MQNETLTSPLCVVADENIPGLEALLGGVARIIRVPGRSMNASHLQLADVLLVRSVTPVNATLLQGTPTRFVGSCTIGTDHVDLDWLKAQGIAFAHAPGCNAAAVVDYVIAALLTLWPDLHAWSGKRVGIVGLGQVGGRLQQRLAGLGVEVLACDPYVAAAHHSLDEVLACDAVSLHVPLTRTGPHATWHMLDERRLEALPGGTVLINTCRGPVIDNAALQRLLPQKQWHVVLDVYEAEPSPPLALLQAVHLATPHIAGYSLQGKLRGTQQVVQALFQALGMEKPLPDVLAPTVQAVPLGNDGDAAALVRQAYDIQADSAAFIGQYAGAADDGERAEKFDRYRKHYPVRHEFAFRAVDNHESWVKALGFGGW